MEKPNAPIFAPIPIGDDRQVGRTRRGIHCPAELLMKPDIVYLHCMSCNYDWYMNKNDYVSGTGMIGLTPDQLDKYHNVGIGGTGYKELYEHDYNTFDRHLHDCCTGGVGQCGGVGQSVKIADYYPYTGCTGEDGSLTGGTGEDGNLIYNEDISESLCLGDSTSIYAQCLGKSGSAPSSSFEWFTGGFPVICPNCCRVNFEAKWVELNDNPRIEPCKIKNIIGLKDDYQHPVVCTSTLVRDVQRIKTHYDLGIVPNSPGINPQLGIHSMIQYRNIVQVGCE